MDSVEDLNSLPDPADPGPLDWPTSPASEPLDLDGDPAVLEAEADRLTERWRALAEREMYLRTRLEHLEFERDYAFYRIERLRKAAAAGRFRRGRCMLPTLPPDVLIHIIKFLPCDSGTYFPVPSRAVWALAMTCRALWEHCQPLFYNSISLSTWAPNNPASAALLLEVLENKPALWMLIHHLDLGTSDSSPTYTSILAGCVNVETFIARSYCQAIHTPPTVRVLVLTGLPLGVLDDVLPLPSLQHLSIFRPLETVHSEAVWERLRRQDSMGRMSMRSVLYDVGDTPVDASLLHRTVDTLGQWSPFVSITMRDRAYGDRARAAQSSLPAASQGCRPVTLGFESSSDTLEDSVLAVIAQGCLRPFDSVRSIHIACQVSVAWQEVPADLFARLPPWTDQCTLDWSTLLDPSGYRARPRSADYHQLDHFLVALARTPDPLRRLKRVELWSEPLVPAMEEHVSAFRLGCHALGFVFVRFNHYFLCQYDNGLPGSTERRMLRVLWEDAPCP